jgi:PknH-like protein
MSDRTPDAPTAPDRSRFRPWLVALVAALVVAGLLAWRPWAPPPAAGGGTTPTASASASATTTATPSAQPSPGPSATTGFDAATAPALFLTDAELARAVPDAAGLSLTDAAGARWGLPEGSVVEPPSCTPAVTVVEQEPEVFLRRIATSDVVSVLQSVAVLPDAATAGDAFDALVGTLQECPAYQQVNPGIDGGSWTAEPPTTERGAVPTTVHRMVLTAEGATSPEVEVTALAGNALVTTTASWVDPAGTPGDTGVLAEVAAAAAQRALDGLG